MDKGQSDEEIVAAIQQGDREQYGILMERYEAKLTRYGGKFLAYSDSIGDIVQDVFISAYQNIHSFDTQLKFSSWIYRIAHNAFVNELRKQQRGPVVGLDLDTFVSHLTYKDPVHEEREYTETKQLLERNLEQLSQKHREALILHYLEDMSYKEISDILQIPVSTVGVRVLRGREALKKLYATIKQDHDQ